MLNMRRHVVLAPVRRPLRVSRFLPSHFLIGADSLVQGTKQISIFALYAYLLTIYCLE